MMNPRDTFNLLSFSGGTGRCFDKPVPNTAENRATALKYLADLYGSGGTEMMKAIKAALESQDDPERVRIVCFMTDGYIGNDFAIIDAVRRNAGTARVFAFGIGNSVNRFLLDGMAHAGRGEVEYVTLASQGEQAAKRFAQRINAPVLTDIEIDWGELSAREVYPAQLPDLFSVKPIMIHGRLAESKSGTIVLRGQTGEGPFERAIRIEPPATPPQHLTVASLWARAKVSHLMHQDMAALQRGNFPEDLKGQVTQLGLDYNLMTQFTSFVAVEEMTVTVGGEPVRVDVPVEMPDGVSYDGVFGCKEEAGSRGRMAGQWMYKQPVRAYGAALTEVKAGRLVSPMAAPRERMNSLRVDVDRVADDEQKPSPQAKLAQPLQGLAEKVANQGTDGNLNIGKLRVIDYKVDVMIYLRDVSADTLAALTKLGFAQKADSKAVRLVIGSIDVRKLEELAKLDAVLRITPVGGV
jgi:Ca-activated chloride channel family protein